VPLAAAQVSTTRPPPPATAKHSKTNFDNGRCSSIELTVDDSKSLLDGALPASGDEMLRIALFL